MGRLQRVGQTGSGRMKIYEISYKKDHVIKVRYEKDNAMFTDEVYLERSEDELADTVLWEQIAGEAIDEIEKIKRTLGVLGDD